MILPFSDRRKIYWNVEKHLDEIDRVIAELNVSEVQKDFDVLLPKLQKHGLVLLINQPKLYNGTWYEFQVTALKHLRRHIRNGKFDAEEWKQKHVEGQRFVGAAT